MTAFILQVNAEDRLIATFEASPTNLAIRHGLVIEAVESTVTITGTAILRQSGKIVIAGISDTIATFGSARASIFRSNVFRQFSIFGSTMLDPAKVLAVNYVSGVTAYDAAAPSAFRRISMRAALPEDSDAWKRAAYVAPGIRVAGLAPGEKIHVDAAQVEWGLQGSNPSAYTPARALKVSVRPDRLNLAEDPRGTVLTTTVGSMGWVPRWFGSSGAGNTTFVTGGAGPVGISTYLRKTWTTAPTGNNATGYQHYNGTPGGYPVKPGETFTLSSYLRSSAAGKYARPGVEWRDSAGNAIGLSTQGALVLLPVGEWVRIAVKVTVPNDARVALGAFLSDVWEGPGSVLWAAGDTLDGTGLLVERTSVVGDYFDGNSGPDYLWEGGVTGPTARAYYYKDYADRSYLLKQIIAENCPMGVIPAQPEFATLPKT